MLKVGCGCCGGKEGGVGVLSRMGKPSGEAGRVIFFFKQKTAYEIEYGLVGSEMWIRDRSGGASVYGAAAWVRYAKWIAPLSVS